jgi:UDP-glucuronate 4-epimerase
MHARGERAGLARLALSPIARFLRFYVVKLGFLDGAAGFAHIAIGAFASFLKYAKLRAPQRARGRCRMKRVLVTGAAGFIGMHTSAALLARGDAVVGVDDLDPYYDVALKQARLAELTGRDGFAFERLDLADADATARLFRDGRFDGVVHLAAQPGVRYSLVNPCGVPPRERRRVRVRARRLPPREGRAPRLRVELVGVRREPRAAVLRGPADRPPGEPLRGDQEGRRADGALLRAPVRHSRDGTALLHRLRPVGTARPGADAVHARDPRRRADPRVQPRQMRATSPTSTTSSKAWLRVLDRPPAHDAATGAPHAIYNIGNHEAVELDTFIATLERLLGRPRSATRSRCSRATCRRPTRRSTGCAR